MEEYGAKAAPRSSSRRPGSDMDGSAAHSGCSASLMERKMSAMACEVFNELRLEGKLCDVIIDVNGCQFNAHKNILCSCSHYFRSVLGMVCSGNGDR